MSLGDYGNYEETFEYPHSYVHESMKWCVLVDGKAYKWNLYRTRREARGGKKYLERRYPKSKFSVKKVEFR